MSLWHVPQAGHGRHSLEQLTGNTKKRLQHLTLLLMRPLGLDLKELTAQLREPLSAAHHAGQLRKQISINSTGSAGQVVTHLQREYLPCTLLQ